MPDAHEMREIRNADSEAFDIIDGEPWFRSADWPLAGPEWPGTFPKTCRSESGLVFVIDLDATGRERCKRPTAMRDLDGRFVAFCMMPKGHDTPHLPMSVDLDAAVGPMIVREMARG